MDAPGLELEMRPLFLGAVRLYCRTCGEFSDEVEIGLYIDTEDPEDIEAIGVVRYDGCNHTWSCECLTDAVADLLNEMDEHEVSAFSLMQIDGRTGCCDDDYEDEDEDLD